MLTKEEVDKILAMPTDKEIHEFILTQFGIDPNEKYEDFSRNLKKEYDLCKLTFLAGYNCCQVKLNEVIADIAKELKMIQSKIIN